MLQVLEPYLQKKIMLAKIVYTYGMNIPDAVLDTLDVSKGTLKKYLDEIQQKVQANKPINGSPYIVDSLQKITQEIMNDSMQLQLLKLLFLYPGERAEFYKKKLVLSDATFSRYIANLKNFLQKYDITIVSKSGYIMECDQEWFKMMLFTHLACFYQWDSQELDTWLYEQGRSDIVERIDAHNFDDLTFAQTFFENKFFVLLSKLTVIRQKQMNSTKNFDDILIFLDEKLTASENKVQKKWDYVLEQISMSQMSSEQQQQLFQLLVRANFQIELFPYNMSVIPLRHMLFADKYALNYPEKCEELRLFIERLSSYCSIDFTYRYPVIFHFLVIMDIVTLHNRRATTIYVHSDLGQAHKDYLYKSVHLVADALTQRMDVLYYDAKKEPLNEADWIVTNRILQEVPERKQILVGDYLSAYDFLMMKNFLNRVLT